jgi:hypothetical protein
MGNYWKQIIRKCINKDSIFKIPLIDLEDLIEHCEINIPHGSIYAHTLMELLRAGRDRNKNFLGLGDWDLSSSSISYRIISEEDSVETANFSAILMSAPTTEPRLQEYPSRFAWLKAKVKWDMAQNHQKTVEEHQRKIDEANAAAPTIEELSSPTLLEEVEEELEEGEL